MLNRIYQRAQKLYEQMTPEQQDAEERDMEAQGISGDEDRTMEFVKKYTDPELFQAALQGSRPNTTQEVGGALAAGLGSYGASLQGKSGAVAGKAITDTFRDLADRPANDLVADRDRVFDYLDKQSSITKGMATEKRAQAGEKRAVAGEDRKATKFDVEQEKDAAMRDPNSPVSQVYRMVASQSGVEVSPDSSAFDLEDILDPAAKAYAQKTQLDLEAMRQKRADAKIEKDDARYEDKKSIKAEEKLDKQVAKIPKALGALEQLGVIRGIENQLGENGMSLEEYSSLEEKPDLPGANFPGLGRVSFYSGEARELQARTTDLANRILKERSGAAVTTPEFDRFLRGAAQGKFNTEKEMFEGLGMMKKYLLEAARRQEAAIDPEALQRYRDNDGLISDDYAYTVPEEVAPDMVKVIGPGGERGSIPAANVEAFVNAGGRVVE